MAAAAAGPGPQRYASGAGAGSAKPIAAPSEGTGPPQLTQQQLKMLLTSRDLAALVGFVRGLRSGEAEHRRARRITDDLSWLLQHDPELEVHGAPMVGGSFKKGTSVRANSDIDLVVALNNYDDIGRCAGALERVHVIFTTKFGPLYTCISMSSRHLSFRIRVADKEGDESVPFEVDLLPVPSEVARATAAASMQDDERLPHIASAKKTPPPPYAPERTLEQVVNVRDRIKGIAKRLGPGTIPGEDTHQFVVGSVLLCKWLVKSLRKYHIAGCLVELFVLNSLEDMVRDGAETPTFESAHHAYVLALTQFLKALGRLDVLLNDANERQPDGTHRPLYARWYADPTDPSTHFTKGLTLENAVGLAKWAENTGNLVARIQRKLEHERSFARAAQRKAKGPQAPSPATALQAAAGAGAATPANRAPALPQATLRPSNLSSEAARKAAAREEIERNTRAKAARRAEHERKFREAQARKAARASAAVAAVAHASYKAGTPPGMLRAGAHLVKVPASSLVGDSRAAAASAAPSAVHADSDSGASEAQWDS